MGKNAKLGIAAGVVLLLALIVNVVTGSSLLALALVLLGGFGIVKLYQNLPDDDGGGEPGVKKKKQLQGKKRLDALLEGGTTDTKAKPRPSSPPVSGGLPTWGGGAEVDDAVDDIEVVDDDAEPVSDWDSWDSEWRDGDSNTDADVATLEADELELDNPLDNLDRLDDIDPIAEVERLDALDEDEFDALGGLDTDESLDIDDLVDLDEGDEGGADVAEAPASSGGAFSFSSGPAAPVINEDVSSADDIMAASQATELVDDAADSELAKLLAKVQARLAAYE